MMKMKSLFILLFLVAGINNVYAKQALNPKQIQVPFINEAFSTPISNGLAVNYDMNGTSLQQVVCTLSYIHKSWLEYTENGAQKESGAYGGAQTVVLTSKGQTGYISETLDQLHVDAKGTATFFNHEESAQHGFISCFYMPDPTVGK